jgi:hypothetical protein
MNPLAPSIFAWRSLVALGLVFACGAPAEAAASRKNAASRWEQSVVTIEIARNQYDMTQPWSRRTRRVKKSGIVIGEKQLLTTADQVYDRTLVRFQKNGRGQWWSGSVEWVDYHANLAILTSTEPLFWRDLKPVSFGSGAPEDGNLQVLRWNDGNLERRRAEFVQFTVREEMLSPISHVMLQANADIQGTGWGEPIVAGSKVLGLVIAQDGRTSTAMPASFIHSVLSARKQGKYRGLGFFHFYWGPAENPASLTSLKLAGPPRGVIVNHVGDRPDGAPNTLKPKDIILNIDGFDLDIQGDYEDPEFGHLMLENLATRNRWAGDDIKMRIFRDGEEMDVLYRLPKYDYAVSLVPHATYDQEPEYLVVGGLIFQPLTDSYLQSWGSEWKRRSPFRLFYYRNEPPSKERRGIVFLSQVLPDPYNIGYQDLKYLVLETVNGQTVNRMAELVTALGKHRNGYHVLEFVKSDSLRRLVLDAGPAEQEATIRVLKRYGIAEPLKLRQ